MNLLISAYHGTGFGGAERSGSTIAEGLEKRGHSVFMASTAEYEGLNTLKFSKYPLPLPFFQRFYLKNFLKKIIKKEKIDIIHAQDRLTSIGAVLAAKECGIPAVVHFRDYWFCCTKSTCLRREGKGYATCRTCTTENLRGCVPWYRLGWETYKLNETRKVLPVLDKADVKIAISNAVKKKMMAHGLRGKIEVLPNPVDTVKFVPVKGGARRGKVVTFVGRLSYEKGIAELMKIMQGVLAQRKDVRFLIVGEGPMKNELEEFVQEKGLAGNVEIAGRVLFDELPAIYANSDVVLFPSQWEEPFGRIAIEAGACGTPVVASKTGGITETVVDGRTGFLVSPSRTEEWVAKINELLDNDSMRAQMGKSAREFAVEKFSTDVVVQRLEKIYKGVL